MVGNGGKKVLESTETWKERVVNMRNGDKFYSIVYDFAREKAPTDLSLSGYKPI